MVGIQALIGYLPMSFEECDCTFKDKRFQITKGERRRNVVKHKILFCSVLE